MLLKDCINPMENNKPIAKRNALIFNLSQFCHSLIFTIPIWIVYYQSRISLAEISLVVAFQYITQMVFELPSGAMADLIGRRNTTFLGYFFAAIGYLLFPFADSIGHFILIVFLIGLADSFRSGAEEALLYDSFVQDGNAEGFKKAYANSNIVYSFGLIISTALGGILFGINNHLPYVFYGISLTIGAVLVAMFIEPIIDSEKFTLRNYIQQIKDGSREVFKNDYNKYLSLYYIFVGGIAWSGTLYFNEYMLVDLGFSADVRGYLSAGMRLINVFLIAKVLQNNKLFGTKGTFILFPVLMLFAYLPGYYLQGIWGLPFIQAAMIATTARWIILSPLVNEVFSSKFRATAISYLSLLIGFVYVALTAVSGLIIPLYGVKTMYSLLGIIVAITVVPLTSKLLKTKVITLY